MSANKIKAWAYLIILSIVWGSSYFLIKIGLEDSSGNERMPPELLGALRISFAFLALTPLLYTSFKKLKKKHILFVIISGVVGNGLPAFLFAYAETKLDSSITGMLNSLVPIFTVLIATIVFKFKLKWNHIAGLTVGILGAFMIVYHKLFSTNLSLNDTIPILTVVLATFCYALSLNVIKYKLTDLNAMAITSISFAAIGPFCIVYLFTTNFFDRVVSQPNFIEGIGIVGILAFIGTAMAVLLFNNMIKISTAIFASSITYFIPIVAILLGLTLGENISILQLSGIGVLILGVFLINRK
ncbi:MAG: DMT family transporter [Flavobacteriales bacterium]|nr:DMT family transporter [Flavobacteriales bacterium]